MERGDLRIAIIGAGPGGLCTGKRFLDEGYDNFVILERSDGVGGTWRRNRYPGCECDVPSALYSFSFAFKTDWSKPYGTQPEILAYMEQLADTYGLLPHCRFNDAVERAVWSDTNATWSLTMGSGETITADVVVSALGMFGDLAWPNIDGINNFDGAMWHSAQWNWDHSLAGQRVAVIGSAASAVQFVPEIVKSAAHVSLFQRTPNWVLPKIDTPYTAEQLAAFADDPTPLLEFRALVEANMNAGMTFNDPAMLAERETAGLGNIDVVDDLDVRSRLRPTHPFGCKRPLFSNKYYPAFNQPNLTLITDSIERIDTDSVVTSDGTRHEVDVIVAATGFSTTKYISAIEVTGRDGVSIADAWNDGPLAHLGITTSGFPNLYMLYGPNTNNGSILTMIEYQVDHILEHLDWMRAERLASIEVTIDAMRDSNDDIQRAIAGVSVWQAGCTGYYRSASGRVVTQWPYSMIEYQQRTATLDRPSYRIRHRNDTVTSATD